jgi:hypothetical protein
MLGGRHDSSGCGKRAAQRPNMRQIRAPKRVDPVGLDPADRMKLRRAVGLLERKSLVTTAARAAGRPVATILSSLPNFANDAIQAVARQAILQCFRLALRSTRGNRVFALTGNHPTWASGIAGAIGGSAGLPGTLIELPITTIVIFQSIAKIASEEGEDLTQAEARLACLEVFALNGGARDPGGYYAVRNDLAKSFGDASRYVLHRTISKDAAPALARFLSAIGSRFGIVVSERLSASALPFIGAVTGASFNIIFLRHFESTARGHFAVRALERKYGPARVRKQFELIRAELGRRAPAGKDDQRIPVFR